MRGAMRRANGVHSVLVYPNFMKIITVSIAWESLLGKAMRLLLQTIRFHTALHAWAIKSRLGPVVQRPNRTTSRVHDRPESEPTATHSNDTTNHTPPPPPTTRRDEETPNHTPETPPKSMASAGDDKREGKRPMPPEEEPAEAAAAGEANTSPPSEPEAGVEGEKQQDQAADGDGAECDDDLVLVTECGTDLRLSRRAARMSAMLNGMMEGGCAVAGGRIAIPGVHAGILRMVAAYCENHGPHYDPEASAARDRDPFPPFPIEFTPATHAIKPVTEPEPDPHGLEAWDKEFITAGVDNSTLFAIILAANFMGIDDLLDLGCTAVADKMRGKTPEEIRDVFDIENDYTPEQEAEVRKANAWAFED